MRRLLAMACLFVAFGLHVRGAVSRIAVDRSNATADVIAEDVALTELVNAARLRTGTRLSGSIPDRLVTLKLRDVPLDGLVEAILVEAGLRVDRENGALRLRDPEERTVSLDLVAADVRTVIGMLAEQCGVRNVMIDPGVDSKGTFRFHDVPCSTAFPVVFATMGIDAEIDPGELLVVRGHE